MSLLSPLVEAGVKFIVHQPSYAPTTKRYNTKQLGPVPLLLCFAEDVREESSPAPSTGSSPHRLLFPSHFRRVAVDREQVADGSVHVAAHADPHGHVKVLEPPRTECQNTHTVQVLEVHARACVCAYVYVRARADSDKDVHSASVVKLAHTYTHARTKCQTAMLRRRHGKKV